MKNKLYIISAAILCLSVFLSACNKDAVTSKQTTAAINEATTIPDSISETENKAETATYVDESGYHVVSIVMPTTEKRTTPPVPTRTQEPTYKIETSPQKSTTTKAHITQNKTTQAPTVAATEKVTSTTQAVTIPDKSNGISLILITKNVSKGNDASIAVSGTSGKEYTIEIYRNDKELLSSDSLKPVTADSSSIVTWNFSTQNCDKGQRKIIIRETGSDKYIQTSINVL